MKNENNSLYKFIIYPRSLIILSNESRWNYMHRVIPTNDSFEFDGKKYINEISRISIVFGCHKFKN